MRKRHVEEPHIFHKRDTLHLAGLGDSNVHRLAWLPLQFEEAGVHLAQHMELYYNDHASAPGSPKNRKLLCPGKNFSGRLPCDILQALDSKRTARAYMPELGSWEVIACCAPQIIDPRTAARTNHITQRTNGLRRYLWLRT